MQDLPPNKIPKDNGVFTYHPTAIHPFSAECVTSSSYAQILFRKYVIGPDFLYKVGKLPIIKDQHLQGFAKSSIAELEFLSWKMKTNPNLKCFLNSNETIKIKCGLNEFEPDAYDPTTKHIIEFHGCYWHACYECIQNPRMVNSRGIDVMDIRARDKERRRLLLSQTDKVASVEVMWECQWNHMKETIPEIKKHVEEFKAEKELQRLDLRSCFKGGLSDCFSIYANVAALIKMLQEQLGPDATDEEKEAINSITAHLIDYTSQVN